MESGYVLTRELLDSGKEFTAIFALSDTMAVGACRAIVEAGKRVPEDYSVAGFDGIELCSYYNPTLTTIRQPIQHIAEASVKLLFDILAGRSGISIRCSPESCWSRNRPQKDNNKAQHIPVWFRKMLCLVFLIILKVNK